MIQVSHLSKKYGSRTALDDVSFDVESGHIYGLLGPNGAGKSTTMNIITGCLSSTDGKVLINGYDIFEEPEKAKKFVGYLPEQPPLYQDMTVTEYLTFVAKAKGAKKSAISSQVSQAIENTQISDVAGRLIKHLSKGYKQRVGIAQALIGNPEIIILDEPTVGLDPLQIIEIRDLIKQLGATHTVILSSHILSEVRAVCDHIMIISHGKLVASDTPENLESLLAGAVSVDMTVKATEEEVRTALSQIETISEITCSDAGDGTLSVSIRTGGTEDIRERVFFAFCDMRRPILQLTTARTSLEDVFLELTSHEPSDGNTAAFAETAGIASDGDAGASHTEDNAGGLNDRSVLDEEVQSDESNI